MYFCQYNMQLFLRSPDIFYWSARKIRYKYYHNQAGEVSRTTTIKSLLTQVALEFHAPVWLHASPDLFTLERWHPASLWSAGSNPLRLTWLFIILQKAKAAWTASESRRRSRSDSRLRIPQLPRVCVNGGKLLCASMARAPKMRSLSASFEHNCTHVTFQARSQAAILGVWKSTLLYIL